MKRYTIATLALTILEAALLASQTTAVETATAKATTEAEDKAKAELSDEGLCSTVVESRQATLALQLGGRYYAEGPSGWPEWGLRFQIRFLFPTH